MEPWFEREMIDCSEAREGLWPPERPRLARDEVLKARSHVEGCASCTEYFAQDTQLLGFYDQLRQTGAPRAVRERVFDALAAEIVDLGGQIGQELAGLATAGGPLHADDTPFELAVLCHGDAAPRGPRSEADREKSRDRPRGTQSAPTHRDLSSTTDHLSPPPRRF